MNQIPSPFTRGQQAHIPAGVTVRSTNPSTPRRVTKTTRTVTLRDASPGWVDTHGTHSPRGAVVLPLLTWAGGGGYWQEVRVTPQVLHANGITEPLPCPQTGAL